MKNQSVVFLCLLFFAAGMEIVAQDTNSPSAAQNAQAVQETNAYVDFSRAMEMLKTDAFTLSSVGKRSLETQKRPEVSWQENTFLAGFFSNLPSFFNEFDKGYAKARIQIPGGTEEEVLKNLTGLKDVATIRMIDSKRSIKRKDFTHAAEGAFKNVRLGSMLQKSEGPMVVFNTGLEVKQLGVQIFQNMSFNAATPSELLTQYSLALADYQNDRQGFTGPLKLQFDKMVVPSLEEIARKPDAVQEILKLSGYQPPSPGEDDSGNPLPPNLPTFDPAKTKAIAEDLFRKLMDELNSTNQPQVSWDKTFADFRAQAHNPSRGVENQAGELFLAVKMAPMSGIQFKAKRMEFLTRSIRLAMAASAYYKKNQKFPETLESMVPEYVQELPKDPFDGKPLRYNASQKLIYSVGTDLKDDNGKAMINENSPGDLVIRLSTPK